MKTYFAKSQRPAVRRFLVLMTVLALTLSMSCSAAFAMVDISDKFYITDEPGVITDYTEDYIVSQNAYLEQNCDGAQIVVVVVDFLDGMDIEDYCYRLFNDLGIGSASEDNGVLLLLTIGEENYFCMQGTGLINSLSSGTIDDILWNYLEPDFADGDYDEGVQIVFDALYNELCRIYGVDSQGSSIAGGAAGLNNPSGNSGSGDYYDGGSYIGQVSQTARIMSWIFTIFAILVVMFVMLFIYTMIKKSTSRRSYHRPPYHPVAGPHPGRVHPAPRPRRTRPVIYMGGGRTRPSRPNTRNSSGGLFGGPSGGPSGGLFGGGMGHGGGGSSRGGGAGRRSSGSSTTRHTFGGGGRSSFGGGRPSGRGGGGGSRGGGAGRRGR